MSLLATATVVADEPLRVMSFNIRYGNAKDGDNHWDKRKTLVTQTIRAFQPDLLGTQETLKFQAEFIQEQLQEYEYFGRSRMTTPNEHCGIFYKSDRFTWLAGGHFWLSESPEIPESKSWDSSLPRMATWVLLQDKMAGKGSAVLFINTHFDHRGAVARQAAAQLIRQRIPRLAKIADRPHVIVTGDFNTGENSPPYEAFLKDNDELADTYRSLHGERKADEGTFNGWQGRTAGPRIDWILAGPSLTPREAAIDRTQEDGRYPSDHFPVTAILETHDTP